MPSNTRPTPQDRKPGKKKGKKNTTGDTVPEEHDGSSPYAPTVWGSGGGGPMEDMIVPSGQRCLVRRPGVEGLMAAGVLHNIDSLSALVGEKHVRRAEAADGVAPGELTVDMDGFLEDEEAVAKTLHTIDRVVCYCVVQPQIQMTPNDVTLRKPGVVYADMVDLVDKMWIFTALIGGVDDLSSFRRTVLEPMGSLDDVEGVPSTS